MDKEKAGRIYEKRKLKNGLSLEILYHSKSLAGDRFYVALEARVLVEITPEYFKNNKIPDASFEDVRSILGENTTYSYRKERYFIAEEEKIDVSNKLREDLLKTSLDYLSSAKFPFKLIRKRYREECSKLRSGLDHS